MGRCAIGTPGLGAVGVPGRGGVAFELAVGAAGAAATGAEGVVAAGVSTAFGGAACGTVNVRRSTCVGTIMRGAAAGVTGVAAGAGAAGAGAFISTAVCGFTATGRAGVGAAGAGGCCLLMMAFSTSPGLEILERSILVLMPSASARGERADLAEEADSADPRKWRRTLSASCSSSELECVFFSVTPTSVRASRIALLFTSSSLARSLIRILLIRLFFPLRYSVNSS
jgi:hypothetical protein